MIPFDFDKNVAYQKALDFAQSIFDRTGSLTQAEQEINRARRFAFAVSMNIAEGYSKAAPVDRKKYYSTARGRLSQCLPLIEQWHKEGLLTPESYQVLSRSAEEIDDMLGGLIETSN